MEYMFGEKFHLGLIGKRLDYSYSKIIHEKYMNCDYDLIELQSEEELTEFFKNFGYDGVNVTNPYKSAVIPYLDALDDIASKTQSVNTIVNHNGKLIGYNTDYFGFEYLLHSHKIQYKDKHIYILGNGSVTKTLRYCLNKEDVTLVTRKNIEDAKSIRYEDLEANIEDIDIIINATPVGVNPQFFDINESVKKVLERKPSIIAIDLNYNPNVSYFCSLSNQHYNGLSMLVKQAVVANNLMTDRMEEYDIESIINDLTTYKNEVIIGMMGAGKTTYGQKLAKSKKLKFVDIDSEIEKRTNQTIDVLFETKGEAYFRQLEEEITIEYASKEGYVISCGGGIVLNPYAMEALSSSSHIIWLDKKIDEILDHIHNDQTTIRPLALSDDEIRKIYNERKELYKRYAMKIVK